MTKMQKLGDILKRWYEQNYFSVPYAEVVEAVNLIGEELLETRNTIQKTSGQEIEGSSQQLVGEHTAENYKGNT